MLGTLRKQDSAFSASSSSYTSIQINIMMIQFKIINCCFFKQAGNLSNNLLSLRFVFSCFSLEPGSLCYVFKSEFSIVILPISIAYHHDFIVIHQGRTWGRKHILQSV